jgi:hypothetical protein
VAVSDRHPEFTGFSNSLVPAKKLARLASRRYDDVCPETREDSVDENPLTHLSHYQIDSKLGSGGRGEACPADYTMLNRRLGLQFRFCKISRLKPNLPNESASS